MPLRAALPEATPANNSRGYHENQAPFNVSWLARTFKTFSEEDVLSTRPDDGGFSFAMHFKPGREKQALDFVKRLKLLRCYPRYWRFNNSVCLHIHRKETILAAGASFSKRQNVTPCSPTWTGSRSNDQLALKFLEEYREARRKQISNQEQATLHEIRAVREFIQNCLPGGRNQRILSLFNKSLYESEAFDSPEEAEKLKAFIKRVKPLQNYHYPPPRHPLAIAKVERNENHPQKNR